MNELMQGLEREVARSHASAAVFSMQATREALRAAARWADREEERYLHHRLMQLLVDADSMLEDLKELMAETRRNP